MKISYNPKSSQTAITTETAANDDIIFDLYASKLWAKGVRIGADWADISSKPSSLKNPYAIKFRDINGNEVSYDGSAAKDLTTGTYIARLPYGFSSFNSKPTWGNTTGTSIACWKDASSGSIDFRKDNPSSGKMSIKVDGRVYVNEGTNPVLSAESNNGFWGMRTPDGANDWIRTPNNGLLPYINGNAGSGHSSLGTNSWYFSTAYIDKVYGSLKGNADTATTATKADNATNAENADKLDGWHKDNIQWTGYITTSAANLQSYWFKIYDVTITNGKNNDVTITFLVSNGYNNSFSIFYLKVRQTGDNGSDAYNLDVTLCELVGNLENKIVAYYNNKTGNVQLWGNVKSQWGVLSYTILKKTFRTNVDFITLGTLTAKSFTSVQTQPTTDYTKVTMSRVGQVQYAESSAFSTQASKLQTARNLWGNSFDGTKDIRGSITFPVIGDTATSSKISWNGSSDGADIYYQTTAKDQGNLVLNVKDDTNAYIQLALNGVFKSHFDVANSYWTGRSALADKWTTARTFTIGNTAKNVDGSGNVSWSLAEIGVRDTWRTVQVNGTSIGNNTLNLCGSTYIGLTNVDGKVTFSLVGSSTTANQAILSNGTANGWALKTLNIANWDTAYNLRHSHANKSVLDGITSGLVSNWNTAYTFVNTITGADTDKVINKWDEIVNFLAGITEDNKLNTLLNSKLSIQQLSAKEVLTTKTNNALFWVNTVGTAGSITTGPFTDHPYALLSITNYSQNNADGKYFYRSRLAFSSTGDIKVASCHHQGEYKQDETWYNVLTSMNSGIDGSTIKLNGTSITVYSSGTADGRYVKKSGDTMTGALNFANGTLNAVGDDCYIGDINSSGCLGLRAHTGTYPGIAFVKNDGTSLNTLRAYDADIRYGSYSLKYLSNGSTSVVSSTWINPFTDYDKNAVKDGQAVCVWGQGSSLRNLSSDGGNIALYLKRISASAATLNMILDGEYYAGGNQRLAHVSEIPTSLKNPHLLTLKANGTILATYDGSSAKEANFTYANVGAASASHTHSIYAVNENYRGFKIAERLPTSGFYQSKADESGGNAPWKGWMHLINCQYSNTDNNYALQIAASFHDNNTFKIRVTNDNVNNAWRDIIHSGNINSQSVASATKLQTARKLWGQSFDGTADISGTLSGVAHIQFSANNAYDIGSNGAASRYIYTNWLGAGTGQKLELGANNSSYGRGLCLDTNLNVGIGTNTPAYKLQINGNVYASSTVTSAGFKHSAVTKNANQYVLTADGGYTFLNQASNELAHEFSKDIAVTSEWTDIEDFYGGNQSFLTQPGTYIVQVYYNTSSANKMYEGYFSGVMSWYTGKTNSNNADEIVLHRAGHAYTNTIYLRTMESPASDSSPYTKLQISANTNLTQNTYKFKFKRIC